MREAERERRIAEMADFRFKLVAELANPYLSAAQRRALIAEKASIEHDVPGLGRRRLSEACIRKWLSLYRKHGKAGLEPKSRRDAGSSRALTRAEAALLLNHLEEKPHLTATTVLRELQKSGAITSDPSTSSLSRLVRSAGLQREKRLRKADAEKNLKFDFFAPLECVQADFMYAVKIPDQKGKVRHALLLVFLDDATRRVLYATFTFSETSLAFEAGISHILSAHGRIGRLYCDNGSPFLSSQTRRILDSLTLVIIHSRPGKPSGRGKIERFFRTARDQFFRTLDPDSLSGIAELDQRFHSWLQSEYHRSPHRGLGGQSPLEAWLAKAHHIIPLDPTVDLKSVFLHQTTRKVHKDSTITLDGVLFEVPSSLIGQRIKLRYDPNIPVERRRLLIYQEGAVVDEARLVDSYANARVRRGDLQRSIQITEENQPPESQRSAPARRPVDNSLSASRLDWDQDDQRSTEKQ
jgi:putative transposase